MSAAPDIARIPEEDRLRADLYNFLGVLLANPADQGILDQAATLQGDESTDLGRGIAGLARTARATGPKAVRREFNTLFIGLGRGELLPYASYYLTGFLNEKPLAALRQDMARNGLARSDTVFEPEDNIASLMEMMAAMIVGRFGPPAGLEVQKTFFNRHIAPWAGHFFADLEAAKSAVFYAAVGTTGRAFMDIEGEAFRLSGA
ncbi:TorD/DmsD family molecular chaperone [Marinibacterium sp. SX1]|uniref:TorD/DmsD family molecular chaperone n=1 Tax=Marinibacterium sp. SX1 TaxID=3388424 RepID=UPI003D1668DC